MSRNMARLTYWLVKYTHLHLQDKRHNFTYKPRRMNWTIEWVQHNFRVWETHHRIRERFPTMNYKFDVVQLARSYQNDSRWKIIKTYLATVRFLGITYFLKRLWASTFLLNSKYGTQLILMLLTTHFFCLNSFCRIKWIFEEVLNTYVTSDGTP